MKSVWQVLTGASNPRDELCLVPVSIGVVGICWTTILVSPLQQVGIYGLIGSFWALPAILVFEFYFQLRVGMRSRQLLQRRFNFMLCVGAVLGLISMLAVIPVQTSFPLVYTLSLSVFSTTVSTLAVAEIVIRKLNRKTIAVANN